MFFFFPKSEKLMLEKMALSETGNHWILKIWLYPKLGNAKFLNFGLIRNWKTLDFEILALSETGKR